MEKIAVFGLGHVGAVTAACLADAGHEVVAIDPDPGKVDAVNGGSSPVREPSTDVLVASSVAAGRLRASTSPDDGVDGCSMALVAVGTPSDGDGRLDTHALQAVSGEIGRALARRGNPEPFAVVVRSTLLPGTTRATVIPLLEHSSGLSAGDGFEVYVNPEFLREGRAVAEFHDPPKVVLGTTGQAVIPQVRKVLCPDTAKVFETDLETAEMVKYVDNSWHALKVAFANEIGSVAPRHGVDVGTLMEIFTSDERLNISRAYLRPGFAFGGSCLPKDVRALAASAVDRGLRLPLVEAILPSNDEHVERACELVLAEQPSRVGVLGLSFKAGTDDLRESPSLTLVRRLRERGVAVRAFDPGLELPTPNAGGSSDGGGDELADVLAPDLDELLATAETLVITTRNARFRAALDPLDGRRVIDLVGLLDGDVSPVASRTADDAVTT